MAELADALDSGSSESNFMQVRPLLPAPRRSKVRFASTFLFMAPHKAVAFVGCGFKKSSARFLASPFHKKSRSALLFSCKRLHNVSLSLPTFCEFSFNPILALAQKNRRIKYVGFCFMINYYISEL